MLTSGRMSFLDSGKDKNCSVSLSNNLDQKWHYTTKIMMEEFSESWRSVLECVFPLISKEYSFCYTETIHYNRESNYTKMFDESLRKSQSDWYLHFLLSKKSEQNIISSNTDFIISYKLTTKFTEHEISDLYSITWEINRFVFVNSSVEWKNRVPVS